MRFNDFDAFARSGFRPRVCIIGSGPAGISLALRLQDRKIPCLVLEAGGYDHDPASQDFYRGPVVGDRYFALHQARLRQFGGTSGHWTGWCRPLDALDFEPRSYIPHSGWPIGKQDLDPYAAAAAEILQVKPPAANRAVTPELDEIYIAFSPPVRFGTAYRAALEQSDAIGLLLNTTVKALVPGNGRIDSLTMVGADGRERSLSVEQVCVCTGGIENSRLLLWSNTRHGGGVVPHAQTLGRYWMEHPTFPVGDVLFTGAAAAQFEKWRFFAPSAGAMQARGIGGAHMDVRTLKRGSKDLKSLARDAMCVAPDFFGRVFKSADKELWCGAQVQMEWEQVPQSENRVDLDGEADAHGVPRTRLHWRKSPAERKTAMVASQLFGEFLIRHDLGRLRLRRWLDDGRDYPKDYGQIAGWHHMGGTRMASSPATGIVDRDCKVFGMDNLYIGGSSVFPTGGHANPTYSIVQLALRLGDHLAARAART